MRSIDRDTETQAALSAEELAGTTFNAYRNASLAAGTQLPPWQDIGEGKQEGWLNVVRECRPLMQDADGMSWVYLARIAHTAFGGHQVELTEEPEPVQLCWLASVRHLANMLDWEKEDTGSVESHEMFWKGWVAGKLPQPEQPQLEEAA
jgi:hypothetical protein